MTGMLRTDRENDLGRRKKIQFSFNGKGYSGFEGDTLASALLANDVHLVGRSFKYHRPRGVLTSGSEEPNALVQLESGSYEEPNSRATTIELYDGLSASSQNCWPSVDYDINEINSLIGRFIPAGFYYKTFMGPAKMWMTYEKFIRKAAGLGKSPVSADADIYEHCYAHCDVLVVGAGPAGLAAARAAGENGARVMLIDEKTELGGSLLSEPADTAAETIRKIDGTKPGEWIAGIKQELASYSETKVLLRTTLTGYYDHNFLIAHERLTDHLPLEQRQGARHRLWKIRAGKVILATGAIERPLVFADNDRPGIMMASAVREYANRYGVLAGKKILVFTNNDSAYLAAADLKRAGAEVVIADTRPNPGADYMKQAISHDIEVHLRSAITSVKGKKRVRSAVLHSFDEATGVVGDRILSISCDCIAMSGGWNPNVSLYSQSRGKPVFDYDKGMYVPGADTAINPNVSVGGCVGILDVPSCLEAGHLAGTLNSSATTLVAPIALSWEKPGDGSMTWLIPSDVPLGRKGRKHFHEFQNDSTAEDIQLAGREGFTSVEHLKRYTTTGMATDQGKLSNVNALGIMADFLGRQIGDIGTTTFRPPYHPVTFGALVGQNIGTLFDAKRGTPMDDWHRENGAVFEEVGDWLRARYYPKSGENMDAAVAREVTAVRSKAGLFDASTLGKIDIRGPDAAEFLNRIYTNAWLKLKIHGCRYGVMLNEQGFIFDDGVTTRLAEDHFHMTTTTGGAARVMDCLEEWLQTEWPELKVYLTSVTDQWAVMALGGPASRKILEEITAVNLDNDAFPFMTMKELNISGVPVRVYRISFSGELSYEINVPARYGQAIWRMIMEMGKPHGLTPYGLEANHVLRAEKGFIVVGQDTDGTITPMDADMDWIVSKKKGDFIGRRSFDLPVIKRKGRKQLVGLLTRDPEILLPDGAHIVVNTGTPPHKTEGHVTSTYKSPNLGRCFAMGLLADGFNRKGETVKIQLLDGTVHEAVVADPVFFDKEGVRNRG